MNTPAFQYTEEAGSNSYNALSMRYGAEYASPPSMEPDDIMRTHTDLQKWVLEAVRGDECPRLQLDDGVGILAGVRTDCAEIPDNFYGTVFRKPSSIVLADFSPPILRRVSSAYVDKQEYLHTLDRQKDVRCVRRDFTRGASTKFDAELLQKIENIDTEDTLNQFMNFLKNWDPSKVFDSTLNGNGSGCSVEGLPDVSGVLSEHGFAFRNIAENVGQVRFALLFDILDGLFQVSELWFRQQIIDLVERRVITEDKARECFETWHEIIEELNFLGAKRILIDGFSAHGSMQLVGCQSINVTYRGQLPMDTIGRLPTKKLGSALKSEGITSKNIGEWPVTHTGPLALPDHDHVKRMTLYYQE